MDEKWQKVREIFDSALLRKSEERSQFIVDACGGDQSLIFEVESLLSSLGNADDFLETPAVAEVADIIQSKTQHLERGTIVSHYEIIKQIGTGGMGEVYLARDKQLERQVAVKVLNERFSREESNLKRFVQEAKAASALNHPNILVIHEIGESADAQYIVSEFIKGETLRELLRKSPLKLSEILDVSIQVASALAAAHEARLAHRDIKPENVMIRPDGFIKVLDFGLAKLVEQKNNSFLGFDDATAQQTETGKGIILGTVNYMSPEQAKGERVDERTDIFSLGILVYEMIAGRTPFAGDSMSETFANLINQEPPPLSRFSSNVPEELQRIVSKMLRKNKDERYQTMKDVLTDLKGVKQDSESQNKLEQTAAQDGEEAKTQIFKATTSDVAPHTASSAKYIVNSITHHKRQAFLGLAAFIAASIALFFFLNRHPVLTEKDTILLADFINTTGDPTFDGSTLKQALAVQLRQTPFLNIYPEEGVRETLHYMGRADGESITPQIGREICRRRGLKALLVGTISGLGQHYVITLEAVNGLTGETIASRQLEAESKEQVLKSLGQAALDLRQQLGESLNTLQKYNAPVEQATTPSLEALNVYSKGLEEIYSGDYKAALPLFNRAVELDPNFAEAYLWLSWTHSNFGDLAKAADAAAKAYALRSRVTELEKLHIEEIYHLFTTGDFEKQKEADEVIKRLYPNDWLAPASLGYGYLRIGQLEQALAEFRTAISANPNECHLYMNASTILIRLNRFDEARETIKQAQTLNLDHPDYRINLYLIGLVQGDTAEMQQQLESVRKVDGEAAALDLEARGEIFSGHWRRAQELYSRAAVLSGKPSPSGTKANRSINATIAGTLFGFCQPVANEVSQTLAISRLNSPVQILYVPVLANGSLCGDAGEAQKLADEQIRRYPNATLSHIYSQPIIRAAAALQRDHADQAVEFLNAATPYEGGEAGFCPDYLRGQSYLRLRRGTEAAAEFQKILDHRGWDAVSPMFPLAHVGIARAAALTGDAEKARNAYQNFLTLWKDADANIPILIEAKQEYEKLK